MPNTLHTNIVRIKHRIHRTDTHIACSFKFGREKERKKRGGGGRKQSSRAPPSTTCVRGFRTDRGREGGWKRKISIFGQPKVVEAAAAGSINLLSGAREEGRGGGCDWKIQKFRGLHDQKTSSMSLCVPTTEQPSG